MTGKPEAAVRAELLNQGMSETDVEWLAPHKLFLGNHPCNCLLLRQLDTRPLGGLIALYEHIGFVQGLIWVVNSFDQRAVELGKQLATTIAADGVHDCSIEGLIETLWQIRLAGARL